MSKTAVFIGLAFAFAAALAWRNRAARPHTNGDTAAAAADAGFVLAPVNFNAELVPLPDLLH